MIEGIWYGLAASFIFIGVIATVFLILTRLFGRDAPGSYYVVIPASACSEEIGAALYAAHLRKALLGDVCRGRILVVDHGMKENQRQLCRSIMRECGGMTLCTPQEAAEILAEKEPETHPA